MEVENRKTARIRRRRPSGCQAAEPVPLSFSIWDTAIGLPERSAKEPVLGHIFDADVLGLAVSTLRRPQRRANGRHDRSSILPGGNSFLLPMELLVRPEVADGKDFGFLRCSG